MGNWRLPRPWALHAGSYSPGPGQGRGGKYAWKSSAHKPVGCARHHFHHPEIACAGLSLKEAEDKFPGNKASDFLFRQLGKAQAMGEPDGLVRIVCDAAGKVLGGQIVGAQASSLISEIALAAGAGLNVEEIAATIHAHPTLAEGVWEAALAASGQPLHG
jgi:Pyruvate/2-oxoglutarate dehydrogenase complex, dihydrolipoamide dehydrogenase (E3) component, and related enzymes